MKMVRKTNTKKPKKTEKRAVTEIHFTEKDILQRWLLGTENCPSCRQIKSDMRAEFKSGKIKYTDVGDDKGFHILTTLSVREAPLFVIELTQEASKRLGIKYIIDE